MRSLLYALAFTALPLAPAAAQDAAPAGITVTGQGSVSGAPDVLSLDLGVNVVRPGTQQAIDDAAEGARAIVDALVSAGVSRDDIRTRTYDVQPEYAADGRRSRVTGYRATNVLEVTIRDVDRAGAIIDAATAAGGPDVVVHGVRFDVEDNREMVAAARAEAWRDARTKARELASLADVELGPPESIVERWSPGPQPLQYATMERAGADTPIEPGQSRVDVSVEVRFGIRTPGGT